MHAALFDAPTPAQPPAPDASSLAGLLDELTACDWHPSVFGDLSPAVLMQSAALEPAHRLAWLLGLTRMWRRHGWALSLSSKTALFELAAAWAAWPLVAAVGEALHAQHQLDGANAVRMINAFAYLGDAQTAMEIAVSLQLAQPMDDTFHELYCELAAWSGWRRNVQLAGAPHTADGELYLEPLGHHHVNDFAWQYYDPDIAELCCLPDFEGINDWHRWLDDIYARGDQRPFAVIHRDWGFIGCVSLVLQGTTGFFYYWIGRDFQGHGFGPRAAALMLNNAFGCGAMRCCFAKVYDYNEPSRKALAKIGFEDLGISAVAPHDDQLFYRLGVPASQPQVALELHALLDYLQSEVRAAAPIL